MYPSLLPAVLIVNHFGMNTTTDGSTSSTCCVWGARETATVVLVFVGCVFAAISAWLFIRWRKRRQQTTYALPTAYNPTALYRTGDDTDDTDDNSDAIAPQDALGDTKTPSSPNVFDQIIGNHNDDNDDNDLF